MAVNEGETGPGVEAADAPHIGVAQKDEARPGYDAVVLINGVSILEIYTGDECALQIDAIGDTYPFQCEKDDPDEQIYSNPRWEITVRSV